VSDGVLEADVWAEAEEWWTHMFLDSGITPPGINPQHQYLACALSRTLAFLGIPSSRKFVSSVLLNEDSRW
jgi:hypothetical protein